MSESREIKQYTLRCSQVEQDQINLEQTGYSHESHIAASSENRQLSSQQQLNEIIDQPRTNQTNVNNCMSNGKCDMIPNDVYQFKAFKDLKKQSLKAILKKWNTQCSIYESTIKNSIYQYNKRKEVERRSINFAEIQKLYHNQSKVKQTPRELDIAFFISSLNYYGSSKTQLRILLNDYNEMPNQQMQMMDEYNTSLIQLISATLKNKIFSSLQELSFQVMSDMFHNQIFFESFYNSLDFLNLKYLQLSFANNFSKFTLTGQSFVSFSNKLKCFCPNISYLVLQFYEIDLQSFDFSTFSDNILYLKNLIFIHLSIVDTPNITTNDVIKLLKGLTQSEKTHIELLFRNAQSIQLNEELFEIVSTILDLPQMYFLKSLCLDFPVEFLPDNTFQKQLIAKMSELFNKTPFLNNCYLFVDLNQKIKTLIYLKSFNYQKIWVQLLQLRNKGILDKFRKEIAWELSEFQEIFIF